MEMASHEERRYAVRARWLFDGTALLDEAANPMVVIEDGRISDVDTSGAAPSDDLPVLDLDEATLLPGLIDAHTHLVFDATEQVVPHVQAATEQAPLAHMRQAARAMLACGITTARDLGDRDYLSLTLRAETARRPDAGPTILAAGPPITPTGGHCWFLGCQADDADAITAAVHDHAEHGVDVIKVMATGGRMTPTTPPHQSQYPLADLRVAVDQAHALGLRAAAHVHGRQGILDALTAGFDTLEHATFMTADRLDPDQGVIDAIARAGTIASPTVGLLPGAPLPPAIHRLMPQLIAHTKNLADSGVRIALGTDGGIAPAKPHTVLPHAIVELVTAGFSPTDALAAATTTAAQACGTAAHTGQIAAGYDADLLAVTGNPLTDISAIHHVAAVYRHGHRIT